MVVTDSEPLWWIPITYTTERQLDFTTTRPSQWMKAEKSITLSEVELSPSEWVIFNIQETGEDETLISTRTDVETLSRFTGYYRVNYDRANWQMIIKQLNKESFRNISTINRAQLIDDALNLARAGKLDYATALDVTSYLAHETEYLPWKAAFTAMHYLDDMLIKMSSYDKFRVTIETLLSSIIIPGQIGELSIIQVLSKTPLFPYRYTC